MKKYLILFMLLSISCSYAFSEAAKEKVMTRAEVIDRISSAEFLKKKIGDLLSWSVGYDITKINRTNLAPTLSWIKLIPGKAPPDNRTVLILTAKVSDPSGLDNIKGVRADLSAMDKMPNTMLVDDGLWGDSKPSDGIYTLQTNVGEGVPSGVKDIPVAVANKLGWVAIGRTSIYVQENPIISRGQAEPKSVRANGKESVRLSVMVENPGRQEDLKEVTADLTAIGLGDYVKMYDDATHGDIKAGDRIFSVSVVPKDGTVPGEKKLKVTASNLTGGSSEGEILMVVQ